MHFILFAYRSSLPLVAAALLLAIAIPLRAQVAVPLPLDAALRLAAERSQQLIAQDAAVSAARDMAIAAGQPPDSTLTAGINSLPINGADQFSVTRDFMTMRSIGWMRELTRNDKLDARSARFEREAEGAEAGHALALARLQRGTAIAWFDRYYQERMRDVLIDQRDEAALQIEAADLAYRNGLGPQSDVFAARFAVAQIEDRIATIDRDIDIATTHLARWVGDAAGRPLAEPPPTDTVPLHATDLETQLAHHPEIAMMLKHEEIARADAEIARANKKADWSVELMYSQRGSDFSDMVSVNVSRPLQWRQRNRQDRELAAKLSIATQMRAEREEETRAHFAEARALVQEWQGNRARLNHYQNALIPLAGGRTLAAITAYRSGTGTLSAVLDSRLTEIQTRLDRLALEMQTAQLWAELAYLIPADHGAEGTTR